MSADLKLEHLNTVETSIQTWMLFCTESLKSDFYRFALEKTGDVNRAAALTLLRNYLSTFSPTERARLETDAEFFYGYAKGFIEELSPFRYNNAGYDRAVRGLFLAKIRALLQSQKDASGKVKDREFYVFVQNIVRICSSLDYILKVHDDYREFLFREMPQHSGAPK
jgi:hypothetical protein